MLQGDRPPPPPSLAQATLIWLRIAALSFGGPAGQIAVMHRILVDEQRWIGEQRFLHALNYCMVLPGPEAQQLATYIGWLMHRTRGGLIAGGLFILPGMAAIMALSWVYAIFGNMPLVDGLFFGLKAAVLAIVLGAVVRIGRRTLKGPLAFTIAVSAFGAIGLLHLPFPLVVLSAGLVGGFAGWAGWWQGTQAGHGSASGGIDDRLTVLGAAMPAHARSLRGPMVAAVAGMLLWVTPIVMLIALLGPDHVFSRIATFFAGAALVTFGGAYAVLGYVAQAAVEHYHWLKPGEMLDGLGMAETTPGPLIMVLQFVGFMGAYRDPGSLSPLLAGTLGGLLATWVTFAPCFVWIFAGAPFVERLRDNKLLAAALSGITAAVVGVILNLAIWFAIHTLFAETTATALGPVRIDLPVPGSANLSAVALSAAAMIATFRFGTGPFVTLLGAALAGIGLRLLAGI